MPPGGPPGYHPRNRMPQSLQQQSPMHSNPGIKNDYSRQTNFFHSEYVRLYFNALYTVYSNIQINI